MFKHFNPNPQQKNTGDCVIRAIAKALDTDWDNVYLQLCIEGYLSSDLPISNSVWGRHLAKNGFKRDIVSSDCPDCYTIEDFCRQHPQGVYVLGTGTHAVAVIDGEYYDAWDSGNEQPIYFYYKGE